ncbi:MAG: hypothetical protein HKM93_08940 [Desulfobacteraceae bacterium]|nr:hypothetical protein [Desulfobacteraceae bacterium]
MTAYNHKLCEERHRHIEKTEDAMFTRLKKVENRFLALMTMLSMNLVGIIGVLVTLILKGQ